MSLISRIEKWNSLIVVEVKVENKVSRQALQKNATGINSRLMANSPICTVSGLDPIPSTPILIENNKLW